MKRFIIAILTISLILTVCGFAEIEEPDFVEFDPTGILAFISMTGDEWLETEEARCSFFVTFLSEVFLDFKNEHGSKHLRADTYDDVWLGDMDGTLVMTTPAVEFGEKRLLIAMYDPSNDSALYSLADGPYLQIADTLVTELCGPDASYKLDGDEVRIQVKGFKKLISQIEKLKSVLEY